LVTPQRTQCAKAKEMIIIHQPHPTRLSRQSAHSSSLHFRSNMSHYGFSISRLHSNAAALFRIILAIIPCSSLRLCPKSLMFSLSRHNLISMSTSSRSSLSASTSKMHLPTISWSTKLLLSLCLLGTLHLNREKSLGLQGIY